MIDFTVNLLAVALLAFIIWWFWVSRPGVQQADAGGLIEVIVENGVYSPANIKIPQGVAVTLSFVRRDPAPCAEKVLFDGLGIALELPLDGVETVVIGPLDAGEYPFSCQMQMYRGSLVVR